MYTNRDAKPLNYTFGGEHMTALRAPFASFTAIHHHNYQPRTL